eukprot:CCRYP_004726-RA/>CCRYP_004726-RA protein AED:0.61 eAED:0.43 QI:0/0/0/1/0/0/2/0/167
MPRHWDQRVPHSSTTKQPHGAPGIIAVTKGFTLAQHLTTITATVLNKESRSVAITDAIKFRHHYLPTPDLTAEDKIIAALQQLHLPPNPQLHNYRQFTNCVISSVTTTTATNPTTPPRVQALPQGIAHPRHHAEPDPNNRLADSTEHTRWAPDNRPTHCPHMPASWP